MRKNYVNWMMTLVLGFVVAQGAWAQAAWKSHKAVDAAVKAESRADGEGTIWLGHCAYDDYIYEYDGLSLEYDARVGVGIKLTRDMFEDYIGGSIEAIRVGWDDRASMAKYECFIRETHFNNPVLASCKGTVKFGWNEIKLGEAFILPDVDTLCVGFYTDLKAGVCSIPKFYPQNKANSCFLFNGEYTSDSTEIWYDSRSLGVMPIMLKIVDKTGQFANLISLNSVQHDFIVNSETDGVGVFHITNKGSNDISTLEVTSTLGEQSKTTEVTLSRPIAVSGGSQCTLPITCFGTGETKVEITKVNGVAPKHPIVYTANLVGVPEAVAEQFVARPVIEFFTSEESYSHPQYFDEYFFPGVEDLKDFMTIVTQHTSDKFMLGDPDADDAILLQLGLANNDSSKIFMPDFAINRTAYTFSPLTIPGTPFHYGVLYPDHLTGTSMVLDYYTSVLLMPTFANVNVQAALNETKDKVNIYVDGMIADGVLPEGEKLNVTVYLMENGVESTDQQFWDDKEGVQMGYKYTHYNIIRENLTGLWGNELDVENGQFKLQFATDVYDDYNKENLSVIVLLNRGDKNSHNQRNVINSAEAVVQQDATGIQGIAIDEKQDANAWYDLSGRRVAKPVHGIYVNGGKKIYVK